MSGRFISFEGGEGSGKTTQIKRLSDALAKSGKKILVTREPGGSPASEAIRELLLKGPVDKWDAVSETLLFQAARVEHVQRVIKPALARGDFVLCDRFLDSTLVYQGIGKGLGVGYIQALHRLTLGNLLPDLVLVFDIDPAIGLKRAKARPGDETRFEHMDFTFHEQVRQGFLSLAQARPEHYVIIDAGQGPDEVGKSVWQAAGNYLGLK